MGDLRDWRTTDGHPPASMLLLHLEGELDRRQAGAVAAHLKDCWICRTTCEGLNQGMYAFVEYRERVLQPAVPTAPPPRRRFSERLREIAAAQPSRSPLGTVLAFRDLLAQWFTARVAWASALSGLAIVILLFLIPIFHPPSVSAKEFLDRARESAKHVRDNPRRVLHQRVRIRQGQRELQRDLYLGAHQPVAQQPAPSSELATAFRLARVEWSDPLNVDRFAEWRDAQPRKKDTVTQSSDFVTLETTPSGGGPVRSASLTVRNVDWRPVAERVEFRDQPALEVTELAFEVREALPEVAVSEAPHGAKLPARALELPMAAPGAPYPSDAQLDDAEVRLREALHRVRADVEEVPKIERGEHEIRFSAMAPTAARQEEILAAVRVIPYVAAGVSDLESTVVSTQRAAAPPAERELYTSDPPLATSLWQHFGGMEAANAYLIRVRDAYLRLVVDSSALKRLAERYPDSEWQRLSLESQQRLDRIAADHLASIASNAHQYLGLVSPVLDEMIQNQKLAIQPDTGTRTPGCGSWRAEAVPIFERLQRLQTAFRALFVVEETETPLTLTAGELLRDAALLRSRVQRELSQLCQMEKGNP